jgi:hypothetical protein
MMLDILAAQRLYGVPTSGPLVDGNDTFGFNANLGNDSVAQSIERHHTGTRPASANPPQDRTDLHRSPLARRCEI